MSHGFTKFQPNSLSPAPRISFSSLPELVVPALGTLALKPKRKSRWRGGGQGRGHLRKPALFTGAQINSAGRRNSRDNITQQLCLQKGLQLNILLPHTLGLCFPDGVSLPSGFKKPMDSISPVSGHLGRWQASRKPHSRPATLSSFPGVGSPRVSCPPASMQEDFHQRQAGELPPDTCTKARCHQPTHSEALLGHLPSVRLIKPRNV